jgi:hypothetical protein
MGILDTIRDIWSFLISDRIRPGFEKLTLYAVANSRQLWTYISSSSALDLLRETH